MSLVLLIFNAIVVMVLKLLGNSRGLDVHFLYSVFKKSNEIYSV